VRRPTRKKTFPAPGLVDPWTTKCPLSSCRNSVSPLPCSGCLKGSTDTLEDPKPLIDLQVQKNQQRLPGSPALVCGWSTDVSWKVGHPAPTHLPRRSAFGSPLMLCGICRLTQSATRRVLCISRQPDDQVPKVPSRWSDTSVCMLAFLHPGQSLLRLHRSTGAFQLTSTVPASRSVLS
jgi:hypothetical protein